MQERNLAIVMIGIVIVFLICHGLRNFIFLDTMVLLKYYGQCIRENASANLPIFLNLPLYYEIMWSMSQLMLTINSSVNMIIYCCLNSKFRKHLRSVFTPFISRPLSFYLTSQREDEQNADMNEVQIELITVN